MTVTPPEHPLRRRWTVGARLVPTAEWVGLDVPEAQREEWVKDFEAPEVPTAEEVARRDEVMRREFERDPDRWANARPIEELLPPPTTTRRRAPERLAAALVWRWLVRRGLMVQVNGEPDWRPLHAIRKGRVPVYRRDF